MGVGTPSPIREYGDIAKAAVLKTVDINITSATDTTIHSPSATKIFVVLSLHLVNDHASDAIILTFKSAGTVIGRERLKADERIDIQAAGLAILRGRAIDEDFVITSTGTGAAKGWAQIGEVVR